jgi:lipopolysaccharide transport system ATP-binding protein
MRPVLEIQSISKKFMIGHEKLPYYSLRDKLSNLFKSGSSSEEFWALRDVSFDVQAGESLGIIGRNGAGKSTLLKILSRITPPSSGRIITRGRIASLLEVGTGFHQELTGRENIFMNGSILGMKRSEIIARFDEIVEFSGTGKFLDTPLKHYSSGMQLRLAFAVAAHLEPEILIIDEVLAVGDSFFQAKCLQKMGDISSGGKTIIFVSHNFSALRSLCKKAVLLQQGQLVYSGHIEEAIDVYNKSEVLKGKNIELSQVIRTTGEGALIFDRLSFASETFMYGSDIKFSFKLKSVKPRAYRELDFGISIFNKENVCMLHLSNRFLQKEFSHSDDSVIYTVQTANPLRPGVYQITFFLRSENRIQDYLIHVASLEITDGNPYNYFDTSMIQGQVFPAFDITSDRT